MNAVNNDQERDHHNQLPPTVQPRINEDLDMSMTGHHFSAFLHIIFPINKTDSVQK